jgi:hypothetical protein
MERAVMVKKILRYAQDDKERRCHGVQGAPSVRHSNHVGKGLCGKEASLLRAFIHAIICFFKAFIISLRSVLVTFFAKTAQPS